MAPTKDKWVRRFIIPETTLHKKGFTIYKVTSVVFLKSSHEEISKVSVWKRYNDFKKLHSELHTLYSQSKIRESYPSFPKPKFFGRFETEVIEERRECALKFLEFIGRHSYLYSSSIFIKFFETSHADCLNDCSQSLSSDTSADEERHTYINSLPNSDISQSILQPKSTKSHLANLSIPKQSQEIESTEQILQQNDLRYKNETDRTSMTKDTCNNLRIEDNDSSIPLQLKDNQLICNKNNNWHKGKNHNVKNENDSTIVQTSNINDTHEDVNSSVNTLDGFDLPQSWPDSSQYILIAAAHMSAAFRHEDLTEYEEAFTQYKMGISSLQSGVESDSNKIRAEIIKEKISKYLERAEKLYNRYLNCNVSLLNKPVSELQNYKVLKLIETVMLVKDVRQNCLNVVKTIEKLPSNKESISNYILRGEIPYMVRLHACVETETTVFLILQHLGRGKLWNFIASHYSSTDSKIITESDAYYGNSINSNDILLNKSHVENENLADKLKENLTFVSTNTKVQIEMEEKYTDVSTKQLLEKAQILLQSVNATLEESNSVTSRLREADRLISQDNTLLLNFKNNAYQPKNCKEVSVDISDISLEIDGTNKNVRHEKKIDKTSNCLSQNNIGITYGQYNSMNSSLSNSYGNLNFDEKDSTSWTDNACTKRRNSIKTENLSEQYKLNGSNYCISDDQEIEYNMKNSNMDIEEELWTIPENVIRLWAAEILLALEALHQQEVIVFDLKPDNILLDDNGHVQLTYVIPRRDIDLLKYKHPYSSPELCAFSPVISLTPSTDIWSFGVILYELIVGNKFETRHPGTFQSHSMIDIPTKLSRNTRSLLLSILKYEPNERMTIPEIKQHPFFQDVNWSSLVNTL